MKSRFVAIGALILGLVGVPLWLHEVATQPEGSSLPAISSAQTTVPGEGAEQRSLADPHRFERERTGERLAPRLTPNGPPPGAPSSIYPSAPILRIEVGQHAAAPQSMSVDASGRYLVTGSYDKTIRVWALPDAAHPDPAHADLELLDVLRPPIAEGNVGNIYAVAISPDGKLVAAGGWTGVYGNHAIYMFERASGRIVGKLIVPEVAQSLAFSLDGHVLAAGLGGTFGLHAWRSEDGGPWRELRGDSEYGATIYGLSFDKHGRLATASNDGQIRVYDPDIKLLVNPVKAPVSARPWGVAFSPDGSMLAVGYTNSLAVTLLDGRTLQTKRLLEQPGKIATGDAENDQNLSSVAWSADGRYLFAGGACQRLVGNTWVQSIRRWNVAGGGAPQDLDGLGNTSTVQSLAPYGASGVLVLGQDPFIGAYDGTGRPLIARGPVQRDMRTYGMRGRVNKYDYDAFRVSNDGIVEFPGVNQSALRFALAERHVKEIAQADAALEAPITTSGAFAVTHWDSEVHPLFQRTGEKELHDLRLETDETPRSLAISRSAKRFVLGTEWYLRLYAGTGKQLWEIPVPGIAWRVNITPDEKLVVAALGDGTVRWYNIEGGKELLALFIREPDREWVAWTPSGYYDSSPGGERLIGWHLNRGPDKAALFYSASRFASTFRRPAFIRQVLRTRQVPAAPPSALATLPPVVRILDIAQDVPGKAKITYIVESPTGQPITALRILVDGTLVDQSGTKGLTQAGVPQVTEITLTRGRSPKQIAIAAASQDNLGDQVIRQFTPTLAPPAGPGKGVLYALIVGTSKFSDPTINQQSPIRFADQDAIDMAAALYRQKGHLYSDVKIVTLVNENATRAKIIKGLDWLQDKPTANDVTLAFLSGHGLNRQKDDSGADTGSYYYVTYDTDFAGGNITTTGLSYTELERYIKNKKAYSKKLIMLDTCHAGQMGETDSYGMVTALGRNGGVAIWASSRGNQDSLELPDRKHGAFTVAVLEALAGLTPYHTGEGHISPGLMTAWLDERIPVLTGKQQFPSHIDINNAPLEFAAVVPP